MTVMKASEFIQKAKDIATNYKTLYVMGCFGAPLTTQNKPRYCTNHPYNKQSLRTSMIKAATEDTFGFDCVCLIKGILWGWSGNKNATYGGAKYAVNGVPDVNADTMIQLCKGVSTSNWDNMLPGEALWTNGHIGIYIGNGLGVECTPSWGNQVQITAVGNIGPVQGYPTRKWKKHGKLPYIEYNLSTNSSVPQEKPQEKPKEEQKVPAKTNPIKTEAAKYRDTTLSGAYTVTASSLNIRVGAGTNKTIIKAIPKGTTVNNYGYYNKAGQTKWLYVQLADGTTGYCSTKYLTKKK